MSAIQNRYSTFEEIYEERYNDLNYYKDRLFVKMIKLIIMIAATVFLYYDNTTTPEMLENLEFMHLNNINLMFSEDF